MIAERLAILSHKYHVGGATGYRVKGGFPALTDEIARHFDRVDLCVPVRRENLGDGWSYRDNVEVVPLPPFQGRGELLRNLSAVISGMRRVVREAGVVYCMGPNDAGVLGMLVTRLEGRPMFASLDTDRARRVLQRDYSPPVKYFKYAANRYFLYPLIRRVCRDVPVWVTGDMFIGEYPAWTQWVKTTLRSDEIPPLRVRGTGEPPWHVVFAGRLAPEKNIDTLIRAVEMLDAAGTPIRCTIVGEGGLRDELEGAAGASNAAIEFAGRIPRKELIDSRFLGADVLALPSLEERQGKVLLEAMACSVPVVGSDVDGIPSVVDHEVNGLLFNPEDPATVSQAIERAAGNPGLRERLVRNGHEYAREHALDVEVSRLIDDVARHYGLRTGTAQDPAAGRPA